MATNTFDEILLRGIRQGQVPARTKKARDWYREQAKKTEIRPMALLGENTSRQVKNITKIGHMYMFFYGAKHKKTLPYYDAFPCIFPFRFMPKHFLGINLHYLPYAPRAKLMDALYDLTTNKRFDESTRLKLSYDVLKAASKYKWFKPTVHMYLYGYVKSNFIHVDSADWETACFLPVHNFKKADARKVWADSRKKVQG